MSTRPCSVLCTAVLIATLAGCATLNRDECLQADWRRIGYVDGTEGESSSRINEHAKACASYGIRPNLDLYLAGRKEGLLSYCQPENGFQIGRSGSEENAAECPASLRPAFLTQYGHGREIHEIENDIASRERQIDSNDKQIRKANNRIADIKTELQKNDVPNDKRTVLLNEFDQLVEQKDKLGRESRRTHEEADRLRHSLETRLKELGR